MDIATSYNFRRVSDALTTSGRVSADALKDLGAQGYQAVVNLLPDDNQHALPGEREIVESQRLEYIHIPVDFKNPTRADFERFSESMDRLLGKKTHVHCAANWRVTAFYSLFEVRRARWTISEATEFIHGVWKPAEHSGWSKFIADILGMDNAEQGVAADRRENAAPAER
jgi:protein tyrosine phosphatase (PTP) superfamily phosphohydrolase (DUF442 family)